MTHPIGLSAIFEAQPELVPQFPVYAAYCRAYDDRDGGSLVDFVEWLVLEHGADLNEIGIDELLCSYFDIDLRAYRREREAFIRRALDELRALNAAEAEVSADD